MSAAIPENKDFGNAGLVIVGSGLAGYTLAREHRKLAPARKITVITVDGGEVYAKPMLSNAFAQGKDAGGLVQKSGEQMAQEQRLTLLTKTRVAAIDAKAKTLSLAHGQGTLSLPYDQLALALGADARPFQAPGSETVTVYSVNDLADYAKWRQVLGTQDRILMIGAGLVGSEFANDLAIAGHRVALVDPGPWPLGRLAPAEVGAALGRAMAQQGMALHMGRNIARLEPGLATLDDGAAIAFDHALSAIGLAPRTELAEAAGLTVERGIVVDRWLRTSDPDIYALGDCAISDAGPLPFVAPLMAEAKALAATLAGTPTKLALPALPVVVKTPCLPLVVCPPQAGSAGRWVVEGEGQNLKAQYISEQGAALGFALTGAYANERQALGRAMPDLLPA